MIVCTYIEESAVGENGQMMQQSNVHNAKPTHPQDPNSEVSVVMTMTFLITSSSHHDHHHITIIITITTTHQSRCLMNSETIQEGRRSHHQSERRRDAGRHPILRLLQRQITPARHLAVSTQSHLLSAATQDAKGLHRSTRLRSQPQVGGTNIRASGGLTGVGLWPC